MDIPSWLDEILSEPVAIATLVLALVTAVLAGAAFWSIKEQRKDRKKERQRQALERIRSWSEDTFEIVSKPAPALFSLKFLGVLWQELRPVHTKSIGILSDAEQVGGNIDAELKNAQFCLSWFIARLMGESKSASFREYFNIKDVVEPIRSIEELSSAKKEVMNRLLIVIQSATKLLVPQK